MSRTRTGERVAEGALGGTAAKRGRGGAAPETAAKATFGEVFASSEFRALCLAQLLSVAGDQLARVAMTVLVYDRTRSALLSALTYAVTFLPWVIGGVGLSGLADRLPRRQVMIACDLMRMVLVGSMVAVSFGNSPALLWVMVSLLFFVTLLDSPFKSARSALLPDILTGERYVVGTAVVQVIFQASQVAGFALGGLAVAVLGPRSALLADAVTFAGSAALLASGVRPRPPAAASRLTARWRDDAVAGIRLVFGDDTLRTLMLFGWLVTFYVVPMGLAVPYAARFRALPLAVATGLVFAAVPLGTAVGAFLMSRLVRPSSRKRWIAPLAFGSCAVLMVSWARPNFAWSLALFTLAGVFAGYQVAANAAFVSAVPAARRGQAFGLANGGMQVMQGLWIICAGAIAQAMSPAGAIAISGGLGTVAAFALLIDSWRRNLWTQICPEAKQADDGRSLCSGTPGQ